MSRKTRPRCAIAAIARGPAAVNNCDPILNQRTTPRSRSASASASSSAGTSSATISRSRGSARVPRRSAIDHRSIRAPHRCVALQAVIHERLHGRPVAPSAPHTVRPGAEETELVAAGVQALEQGERLLAADRSTALRDCREHGDGIVDAGRVPVLERVAVTLNIGNTFEIRSRRRDGGNGGSGDKREHACGDQLHRCLPPWSGPQASVNADGQSRPCPMDSADENSPGCPPLLGRVTVCAQAACRSVGCPEFVGKSPTWPSIALQLATTAPWRSRRLPVSLTRGYYGRSSTGPAAAQGFGDRRRRQPAAAVLQRLRATLT